MSTAADNRPAPRFSRRPEARHEELVDAALAVFGEKGFRGTNLEDVAKQAGVSKGTVYLYFASKDALFRAMVERKVVTLIEVGEAMAREHDGSAAELLALLLDRMCDSVSRDDMVRLTRLVQSELIHFPEVRRFYFEQVIQRHRRLLRSVVERGVAQGEFRREAIRLVPLMVPSIVVHLNQIRLLFEGLDTEVPPSPVLRKMILDFVLDGIRARPKPRVRQSRGPAPRRKGSR
jgi:AcrR family transcriptional regulator